MKGFRFNLLPLIGMNIIGSIFIYLNISRTSAACDSNVPDLVKCFATGYPNSYLITRYWLSGEVDHVFHKDLLAANAVIGTITVILFGCLFQALYQRFLSLQRQNPPA